MAPAEDLLDPFGFPFEERLDRPVGKVADPASHADAQGLIAGAGAKKNALHAAMNDRESAKMFLLFFIKC